MSSIVYFKLKGTIKAEKISFDGATIGFSQLKREIFMKFLGKGEKSDLILSDENGIEYHSGQSISKNSTVIVTIVPLKPGQNAITSQKIMPRETTVCARCGAVGDHYTRFCPEMDNADYDKAAKLRTADGIPTNLLEEATMDDEDVMITKDGRLVKYKNITVQRNLETGKALPLELTCYLCKKLLQNAVRMQCCKAHFCRKCVMECSECPKCGKVLGARDIRDDRIMREKVQVYKEGGDYHSVGRRGDRERTRGRDDGNVMAGNRAQHQQGYANDTYQPSRGNNRNNGPGPGPGPGYHMDNPQRMPQHPAATHFQPSNQGPMGMARRVPPPPPPPPSMPGHARGQMGYQPMRVPPPPPPSNPPPPQTRPLPKTYTMPPSAYGDRRQGTQHRRSPPPPPPPPHGRHHRNPPPPPAPAPASRGSGRAPSYSLPQSAIEEQERRHGEMRSGQRDWGRQGGRGPPFHRPPQGQMRHDGRSNRRRSPVRTYSLPPQQQQQQHRGGVQEDMRMRRASPDRGRMRRDEGSRRQDRGRNDRRGSRKGGVGRREESQSERSRSDSHGGERDAEVYERGSSQRSSNSNRSNRERQRSGRRHSQSRSCSPIADRQQDDAEDTTRRSSRASVAAERSEDEEVRYSRGERSHDASPARDRLDSTGDFAEGSFESDGRRGGVKGARERSDGLVFEDTEGEAEVEGRRDQERSRRKSDDSDGRHDETDEDYQLDGDGDGDGDANDSEANEDDLGFGFDGGDAHDDDILFDDMEDEDEDGFEAGVDEIDDQREVEKEEEGEANDDGGDHERERDPGSAQPVKQGRGAANEGERGRVDGPGQRGRRKGGREQPPRQPPRGGRMNQRGRRRGNVDRQPPMVGRGARGERQRRRPSPPRPPPAHPFNPHRPHEPERAWLPPDGPPHAALQDDFGRPDGRLPRHHRLEHDDRPFDRRGHMRHPNEPHYPPQPMHGEPGVRRDIAGRRSPSPRRFAARSPHDAYQHHPDMRRQRSPPLALQPPERGAALPPERFGDRSGGRVRDHDRDGGREGGRFPSRDRDRRSPVMRRSQSPRRGQLRQPLGREQSHGLPARRSQSRSPARQAQAADVPRERSRSPHRAGRADAWQAEPCLERRDSARGGEEAGREERHGVGSRGDASRRPESVGDQRRTSGRPIRDRISRPGGRGAEDQHHLQKVVSAEERGAHSSRRRQDGTADTGRKLSASPQRSHRRRSSDVDGKRPHDASVEGRRVRRASASPRRNSHDNDVEHLPHRGKKRSKGDKNVPPTSEKGDALPESKASAPPVPASPSSSTASPHVASSRGAGPVTAAARHPSGRQVPGSRATGGFVGVPAREMPRVNLARIQSPASTGKAAFPSPSIASATSATSATDATTAPADPSKGASGKRSLGATSEHQNQDQRGTRSKNDASSTQASTSAEGNEPTTKRSKQAPVKQSSSQGRSKHKPNRASNRSPQPRASRDEPGGRDRDARSSSPAHESKPSTAERVRKRSIFDRLSRPDGSSLPSPSSSARDTGRAPALPSRSDSSQQQQSGGKNSRRKKRNRNK